MGFYFRLAAYEIVQAAILFGTAGRIDLPWFWAYLVIHTILVTVAASRMDPELRAERIRPAPGGCDRGRRWLAAAVLLVWFVVVGLDAGRFGWSGTLPWQVHAAGMVGTTCAVALSLRAMLTNRFFSPVVRLQQERGHHVVREGPYAWVRHPGYAGIIFGSLCACPALGSWWALIPAGVLSALFLRRLQLEEAFLKRELPGYEEYARQVRFRLVPGVW